MITHVLHKAELFPPAKILCLIVIFLVVTHSGFSQNTKGDRPAGSRDNRFKSSSGKKEKKGFRLFSKKRIGGDRAAGGSRTRARARGGERAGKPIKPVFGVRKPKDEQKAWKGDLTGRRLRHKNSSSVKRTVHPQTGPFVKRNPPDRQGRQNVTRGRPVRIPSATGRARKIYPQRGPYVNNPSPEPRDTQRPVSNRGTLARLKKLQTDGKRSHRTSNVRVVPRSISRPYIRHKSINVYANFKRPKRKGERAQTTDLAGRRIRGRNFESARPGVIAAPKTYRGRKALGKDRPYRGPSGWFRSATRPGTAWQGDIAGRRIRHRNRSSKRSVEGTPLLSGRPRSATRPGKKGIPLPGLRPGTSVSGIPVKRRMARGFSDQGEEFSGTMKSRRPLKGGGSVSGRLWNNNGRALAPRIPGNRADIGGIPVKRRMKRPFEDQGEGYTGAMKARRPLKGGGSVSGRLWNNNGRALPPKLPKNGVNISGIPVKRRLPGRGFTDQGEEFTGHIKAKKPLKGGGSVSGKLWNNNERPIAVRQPRSGEKAAGFSGNIKVKDKGPSAQARKAAAFRGKHRMFELTPGFSDQGEEFTGHIKLSRFRKAYIQNKLADENSIKKRRPEKEAFLVKGLQVKVKRRDYVRNNNAAEDALKKLRPTSVDRAVARLQVKVKQYHYVKNPSSADDALKVREPGRAFARATDYQGNIKMQKFRLFDRNRDLHPDARFVRTNKNNVREERDTVTNFKLWWARLFKKQETQPDHLKEKGKKPRYDKGEQGMWYD